MEKKQASITNYLAGPSNAPAQEALDEDLDVSEDEEGN
jgi:hypothetical protein